MSILSSLLPTLHHSSSLSSLLPAIVLLAGVSQCQEKVVSVIQQYVLLGERDQHFVVKSIASLGLSGQ